METGNRLMIVSMTALAIVCVIIAAILTVHGYGATIAAFTGVAVHAVSALIPSALRQAKQAEDKPALSAENVDTVNVTPAETTAEVKP